MQITSEVRFNGLEHSDAVEATAQRWVARLEHVYDRITKCGIVVAKPPKRHRHGSGFQVSVVVEVPGSEIAVTHAVHEDVYVAVADAFRAARRQLQHHVDSRREFAKGPPSQVAG